jgi:hypothetical protein
MPAAEIEITVDLVHALVAEQHPDLADLDLSLVANGWDNAIFRLGSTLAVRVPRRRAGADLVEHEHRWLPGMAERLPIPIAAPVRLGRPSSTYPWSWSICPWFDGEVAADVALSEPVADARRLGAFVAALHQPAPPEAPVNAEPRVSRSPNSARGSSRTSSCSASHRSTRGECSSASSGSRRSTSGPDGRCGSMATCTPPTCWSYDGTISAVLDFGDITVRRSRRRPRSSPGCSSTRTPDPCMPDGVRPHRRRHVEPCPGVGAALRAALRPELCRQRPVPTDGPVPPRSRARRQGLNRTGSGTGIPWPTTYTSATR